MKHLRLHYTLALTFVLSTFTALALAQRLNQPLPEFSLVATDGEVVHLRDLTGTPLVLNFWATWCPPCVEELPLFERVLLEANEPDTPARVEVFLINNNENADSAAAFLKAHAENLRSGVNASPAQLAALGPLDSTLNLLRRYRIRGMPTTFFVDAEGVLRGVKVGQVSPLELQELLADIGVAWQP